MDYLQPPPPTPMYVIRGAVGAAYPSTFGARGVVATRLTTTQAGGFCEMPCRCPASPTSDIPSTYIRSGPAMEAIRGGHRMTILALNATSTSHTGSNVACPADVIP